MKTQLLGFLLAAAVPLTATGGSAVPSTNLTVCGAVYPALEYLTWKEFDAGEEILKEDGLLLVFGGVLEAEGRGGVGGEGRAELYVGRVDYDGATWGGEPAKSETAYSGLKAEGAVTLRVPGKRKGSYAKPFAGLGFNAWLRELDADGGPRGYDENWTTVYSHFGLAAGVALDPKSKSEVLGRVALRLPFYNNVTYDFSRQGGDDHVEVEPGLRPSFFVEAGLKREPLRVTVFYEQLSFGESDGNWISDDVVVWQPEAEARIVGLSAGIAF